MGGNPGENTSHASDLNRNVQLRHSPVSTLFPSKTEPVVPESKHREPAVEFVRWALAQLQIELREIRGHGYVRLAGTDQAAFDGKAEIELSLNDSSSLESCESLDWDGRFGLWLCKRLLAGAPALHLRPSGQPGAVKDISEHLLKAYRVDGGNVHLSGCQLTDYPFLRLSFAANDNGDRCLRHLFVAHDGSSVSEKLVDDLCLLKLERIKTLTPRIDDATLGTLISAGRRAAAKMSTLRDPAASVVEPILISLVWVKQVSGQLQFTIGNATSTLPFSGWAKLLQAQPFVASQSGASTFHLAATDDGRIDAADQIATCQQSARRVLLQDLVTCSATQKQVLAEFTQICAVSGQPTLRTEFANCSVCRQPVSKAVLDGTICRACHALVKIKKDDPRLVWIVGEHPGLDRWNNWQLAETQHVYIVRANSLLKRLLVVVDKETLAVRHLASASRISSNWLPLAGADATTLLD